MGHPWTTNQSTCAGTPVTRPSTKVPAEDRGQRLNIARRCNLWRVGKSSWGSENGRFTDTEMVNLIQKLEKKEWGCTIFSIPTMPIFIAPTWLKYAKYSWDSSIMFLFSELSQLSSVKMIPERASQPGSMVQLGPTKAPSPTLTSGTKRQETHLQKHLHIWLYTYIGVYIYMTMHIYITISMSIYILWCVNYNYNIIIYQYINELI